MTKRLPPEVKAANKIAFAKKQSERYKGAGNPFYGKHHKEETIEKNRKAHLGKPGANLGKTLSEETKEKIRQARLGNFNKPRKKIESNTHIALSNGKFAIVDPEDYEKLSKILWCVTKNRNTFYVHRALGKGKYQTMHHAIMGIPEKGLMIDHINGDGLDNRKCNLRIVTNKENCLNKHWRKGNEVKKK